MSSATDSQSHNGPVPNPADTPESHVALESLLDLVWDCEANWRFDDRLDMATKKRRQENR